MYYIEFIEPKPGVSQQEFQQVVAMTSERWARNHPDDELVLNIGRTWRLGPKPPYMTIWKVKDASALDRWQNQFQEPVTITEHAQLTDVATIVDAGIYEDLGDEVW
jgi:hypothetical protein